MVLSEWRVRFTKIYITVGCGACNPGESMKGLKSLRGVASGYLPGE